MRSLLFLIVLLPLTAMSYNCVVERVIDGDTFVCSGEKVRLIGVDTPESRKNRRAYKQRELGDIKTVVRLGKEAKKFTKSLIPPGTQVRLEFDVQKRDRYGRLLAYVWLPDGRMLNEVLLEEGYAMLMTIPPNTKYVERLRKAYRYAVENGRGLWADGRQSKAKDKTYLPDTSPNNQIKGRCGEKKYCYQMRSCREAMYYYKVCGLDNLDRDHDGVPCEKLCR